MDEEKKWSKSAPKVLQVDRPLERANPNYYILPDWGVCIMSLSLLLRTIHDVDSSL
jgi:hypothetical protein